MVQINRARYYFCSSYYSMVRLIFNSLHREVKTGKLQIIDGAYSISFYNPGLKNLIFQTKQCFGTNLESL